MLHIIQDTREQCPWSFPTDLATVTVAGLPAGDYALAGDDQFAIERKSLEDFVSTVGRDWDRLVREMDRMHHHVARVIVVEGTISDVVMHRYASPIMKPGYILRQISALTLMGVSVLFAGDRATASCMAYALLKRRRAHLEVDC
jgi:ERCC4-type nuclease